MNTFNPPPPHFVISCILWKNRGKGWVCTKRQFFYKLPEFVRIVLKISWPQNFTLIQIQSCCRRQLKCGSLEETGLQKKLKTVKKCGNADYQRFLPSLESFPKRFIPKLVKTRDCVARV